MPESTENFVVAAATSVEPSWISNLAPLAKKRPSDCAGVGALVDEPESVHLVDGIGGVEVLDLVARDADVAGGIDALREELDLRGSRW